MSDGTHFAIPHKPAWVQEKFIINTGIVHWPVSDHSRRTTDITSTCCDHAREQWETPHKIPLLLKIMTSTIHLSRRPPYPPKPLRQPLTVNGMKYRQDRLPIHSLGIPSDPRQHLHRLPSQISDTDDNVKGILSAR